MGRSNADDPTKRYGGSDPGGTAPAAPEVVVTTGGGTGSGRTTITFYLSPTLRNRARAAYRSTSFHERDTSWSEMLCKALLAEVERREHAHNEGRKFVGSERPLSPGRPIGY